MRGEGVNFSDYAHAYQEELENRGEDLEQLWFTYLFCLFVFVLFL